MRWFLLLLLTSVAVAQTAPATPMNAQKAPAASNQEADEEPAPPPASKVAADAAVITIKGICNDKPHATAPASTAKPAKTATPAAKGACETVITRAQFEKLADSLQPNMAPQIRRQLASAYPRILTMASEARKRGLDKDPGFQEKLQFARQQLLMQELNRAIQTDAAKVPDKEVENYYRNNSAAFEQATLQRIFVPKSKTVEPPKDAGKPEEVKAQQEAAEAAMTKEGDALRARAAAGEDFEKLQKEAFDDAAVKSAPPSFNLGKMRRTNLPPGHTSVFDLKPNEVSQVFNDPSGHYIYKLVSKEVPPLDQVKDEIHGTLQNQRMKDALQSIQSSTTSELNEAYFGSAPTAPARGPGRPKPEGSKEPLKTPAQPQ